MPENKRQEERNSLSHMNASRIHSWEWCIPEFGEGLEWIKTHPHEISKKSPYLSDTPGKEVWRVMIPDRYGAYEVVYKKYLIQAGFFDAFEESIALKEARNYKILSQLGIPVARVLACGEKRSLGRVNDAFIITEYLHNSIDGSTLMPGGNLWENSSMRSAFARKTIDWLTIAHRHLFFHNACHPYKILISTDSPEDNPDIMLIDVAQAAYKKHGDIKRKIAEDLVTFFCDLRLSTEEIKMLCGYYLSNNPDCGFSVESLWQALITVG